ncbi:hypothetical protein SAMN04244573_03211 [Azotobacter beijerinckii]|uniref:Uncharacterized protein n=1 Tax=Azotobacter beijerinckii TaxID=170623 RepID=A0A1H9MP08_9GAMM|nr:hypothetical protein [Azotobacter beijerinckii]SER25426.1 hypothetical protein SAMN04244573_03211 [Azotobacter beijerinckii]
MTRKTSAFAAAEALDAGTEFLVRQSGNKRLPRAALQAYIETLLPESPGSSSGTLTALRSDDLGVTETTLVDALTFNVQANTVYRLSASLLYRTTAVGKGIRVGIGGTAGVQSVAIRAATFDSSGAPVAQFAHAKGAPLIFPSSANGGDDNLLEITGQVYTTAAGTLTIQIGAAVQYDYTAAQKGSGGFLEALGTIAAA